MKDIFLKIAKVKDEKSFYKLYPTEESFKAKHGAKIKKAQWGDSMANASMAQFGQFDNTEKLNYTPGQSTIGMSSQSPNNYQQLGYTMPGSTTGQKYNLQGDPFSGQSNQIKKPISPKNYNAMGILNGVSGTMRGVDKLLTGFDALKAEREKKRLSNIWKDVSDLQVKSALSKPIEQQQRQYTKPTDFKNQGSEFFPTYGVGTENIAKDGKVIRKKSKGNPTEIQNTFDPYTLYSDLGNDDMLYAQFGEKIEGIGNTMQQTNFGDTASNLVSKAFNNNAGSQIGGAAADILGSVPIVGNFAKQLAKPIFSLVGGLFGQKNAKEIKRNQADINRNMSILSGKQMAQGIQQQNNAFMEEGGELPLYEEGGFINPQIIKSFGNYDMKDLLPHNNTLRTGGQLKQNEVALDDGLQTLWGGHIKPESYNPYSDGNGVTYMSYGQPHDKSDNQGRTGIGLSVNAQNGESINTSPDVEIENNEALFTKDDSKIILGDLTHPKEIANLTGTPEYANMKYKNIFKNKIIPLEKKQNKIAEKGKLLAQSVDNSPFGKLSLYTAQAMDIGSKMNLKELNRQKEVLANSQQFLNDIQENNSLDKAQQGTHIPYDYIDHNRSNSSGNFIESARQFLSDLNENPFTAFNEEDAKRTRDYRTEHPIQYGFAPLAGMGRIKNLSGIGKPLVDFEKELLVDFEKELLPDPIVWNEPYRYAPHLVVGIGGGGVAAYSILKKALSNKEKPKEIISKPLPSTSSSSTNYNPYNDYLRGNKTRKFQKGGEPYQSTSPYNPYIFPEEDSFSLFTPTNKSEKKSNNKAPQKTNQNTKQQLNTKRIPENVPTKWSPKEITLPQKNPYEYPLTKLMDYQQMAEDYKNKRNNPEWLNPLMNIANTLIPHWRPTDAEGYPDLTAETMDLMDRPEPVYAQKYTPNFLAQYDVSLGDKVAGVRSAFANAKKEAKNNPALLSLIASQEAEKLTEVLGEQDRINQGNRANISSQNTQLANQAQLTNLNIFDKQQERQAQSRANTDAIKRAARQSISSKLAQSDLEKKTLGIYENLYNYRYDNQGRAINMNSLAQFNIPTAGNQNQMEQPFVIDGKTFYPQYKNGKLQSYQPTGKAITDEPKSKRFKKGGLVQALKRI